MSRTRQPFKTRAVGSGQPAKLHLFWGKIGSGKSTLARKVAKETDAILISEDEWLGALYGDEMSSVADYVRFSSRLRDIMGPHVVMLLKAGNTVALDFPANTTEIRGWMRGLIETAGVAHQLHVLDIADDICLARLRARNENGDHPFAPTDAQFYRISAHITLPSEQEGFIILTHSPD